MICADRTGFEPVTSGLTSRRSAPELTIQDVVCGPGRIRTDTLLLATQVLSR